MSNLSLCVLGAGVVGLTTAIELQKEFRNASVTLLSDKFFDKTTSFVAPGLFLPGRFFRGPTEEITKEWYTSSFNHWNNLLQNDIGSKVGVTEMSGYVLSESNPDSVRNIYMETCVPVFRDLHDDELESIRGNWKYGTFSSTLLIENVTYLPWATSKFLNGHGRIVGQKIEQLSELAGKYDAVVNCTGVGARFLCHDEKLVSNRGQLCKVNAPWVDKFYFANDSTFIIPGFEGVSLGTTRQSGNYNENVDEQDEKDIKQRCEAILPDLKNAEVVARRVGLRPHRSPVRVESELMSFNTGNLKLVHNYGHCANGVTAAPGTAMHSVRLLREVLNEKFSC